MPKSKLRRKVQVHLYRESGDPARREYLILQRPPARGAIWQSVTGNIDAGEDLRAAALREVREETGLTLASDGPGEVGVYTFDKNGGTFEEHVFGFRVAGPADVVLSGEHQACEWVGAADAIRLIHYDGIREGLRQVEARLGAGA